MKYDGPTDLIDAALAAAQSEMTDAIYNRENPHFKSQYADLSSVRHATIRALNAHGIAMVQTSEFDNERSEWVMTTELRHKGQRIQDFQPLFIQPGKPQANASERTYVRRGGWSSICGIAVAGEDDDGNRASRNSTEMMLPSELDELTDIAQDRYANSMPALFKRLSNRLGYEVENLSMIHRADMLKVKGWMAEKKREEKHDQT